MGDEFYDYNITFWAENPEEHRHRPYVKDIYAIHIQETCGSLTFDGHYHIEHHPPPYSEDDKLPDWDKPTSVPPGELCSLPQELTMYITHYSDRTHRDYAVTKYQIRCTRLELFESTDVYGMVKDEDGMDMSVCFTPTNKMTIYFDILQKNEVSPTV